MGVISHNTELFASLDIPSMIMSALEEAEKEEKSAPGAKEFEKAMAARADKKFDLWVVVIS